jgi:DoxX-like family
MNGKTLAVSYWTATVLFAVLLVMDGLGGVMQAEAGKEALKHLGYPVYFLPLAGVAKLLAAAAILQSRFPTVKEWAFAGFAFTCFGAFFSRLAVGDGAGLLAFPVIFLGIMLVPYVLWKRYGARRLPKDYAMPALSSGTATPS